MTLARRQFLTLAATAAAAPAILRPHAALAATPPVYSEGNIAIDGSDAVAYFTERRPVAGNSAFEYDWNGATWRFVTGPNRDAFAADPARYAPVYGGYCAWAAAEGYIAPTAPEAWTIHDGRLYLNFSRRIRRRWERDIEGNIARGNANWPGILTG